MRAPESQPSEKLSIDLKTDYGRTFFQLLLSSLIVSVINYTVWFAIVFYVYLQTRSVLATGIISGVFVATGALTGIWFGSLVDHHRKKTVMQFSALVSLILYTICFGIYQLTPHEAFTDPSHPMLWVLVVLLVVGVITGNLRNIAMPTLVTLLIPADRRDRANGLVGTTTGVSFLVTSVISGLLVGASGMFAVLILAMVTMVLGIVHLSFVSVKEERIVHAEGGPGKIDVRGTLRLVRGVPGLFALILFTCFNNLLGGVFMALMDAYGLELVSVQVWGLLWGVLSTGLIIGGVLISRTGLTDNPLKVLLFVNVVLWSVTLLFPLRSSIVVLSAGMYAYMLLMPYAEAAEQTILQKVVPYERQGRVFGFAQSVEQAASPLTAFLIGPITQLVFIPFMTDGAGADAIGSWFGTGTDRGIALVFVIAGAIGLVMSVLAFASKYYRQLRDRHAAAPEPDPNDSPEPVRS